VRILTDDEATWECAMKADRLLGVLPTQQIAYLGDGFPWEVTERDVQVARTHLIGPRFHAIMVGRELAHLRPASLHPQYGGESPDGGYTGRVTSSWMNTPE
jgi:hypothetical protein